MAGSQELPLFGDRDSNVPVGAARRRLDDLTDLIGLVSDDDCNVMTGDPKRKFERVQHHWPSGDRMENFGMFGLHPFAQASRHDHRRDSRHGTVPAFLRRWLDCRFLSGAAHPIGTPASGCLMERPSLASGSESPRDGEGE